MSPAPQLTDEEAEYLYRATCPMCAAGSAIRFRADTGEFVHDQALKTNPVTGQKELGTGHSICWASGLRNEYRKKD